MKSKRPYFHGASELTFKNARRLRKPLTPAENTLWQMLRNRGLLGLKFRRQHPLGPFIADFYCHELCLVIEIDGPIHEQELIKQYDKERERYLSALGLIVIQFTNEDVMSNPEVISLEISKLVQSRGSSRPHP
jgi:very-short-patch-repair endonuclease